MTRGDIFTAATGGGFGGKPRPVLIVQADVFRMTKTLVALIGSPVEGAAAIRVDVAADSRNGLLGPSQIMVDAILPVRADQFDRHVGRLSDADMRRVDTALLLILGIGSTG